MPDRDTCIYELNQEESERLEYEDGLPIKNIVYQYVQNVSKTEIKQFFVIEKRFKIGSY